MIDNLRIANWAFYLCANWATFGTTLGFPLSQLESSFLIQAFLLQMFRLFANLRWKGYSHPYAEAVTGVSEEKIDPSKVDLDPITVTACRWRELLSSCKHFNTVRTQVQRLLDGEDCEIKLGVIFQPSFIPTARKWLAQVEDLTNRGIVRKLDPTEKSTFISGYFAVLKTLTTARAIFSGGNLSRKCCSPPPLNLLELTDFLKMVSELKLKSLCFAQLDLRHWFFQIGIGEGLARLFHIACDGNRYEWCRLPMGWSFSPFIAQTFSYLIYTYKLDHEEELFIFDEVEDHLPRFLRFKKGAGFCTVLYDNFAMVGEDESVVKEVYARVLRNLKIFDIEPKAGTEKFFTKHDLRTTLKRARDEEPLSIKWIDVEIETSANLPIHLGVQLGVQERAQLEFCWRIDPVKIKSWLDVGTTIPREGTARFFARFIGRIVWSQSLALIPLYTIESTLQLAKRIGKFVGTTYSRWDDPMILSEEELHSLEAEWHKVLKNQWRTAKKTDRNAEHLFLFTDASDHGWGFVL